MDKKVEMVRKASGGEREREIQHIAKNERTEVIRIR